MNPLKSSSSQQYNRIDNSHSNGMLPVKRLPTTGDGNCLIHALFGDFSNVRHFLLEEVQQEFFHKNAPAVRFEIAHKLFNQGEGNHAIYEELYSIDELGSATFSQININNLALSMQENGEYLGLEHIHLIAKVFKLNIRVYYPKSRAYEKIDLFHRYSNTQEVDRIVYFNGIDHWEKCELINESQLPSSLDFVSQYSPDESTTASSRRSSFDLRPKPQVNPKYRRIFDNNPNYNPSERIKVNTRAIVVLKCKNHDRMKNSYLFKFCKPQKYNELFLKTFAEFFQHLRGSDPLAMSAGYALADKFRGYQDVCTIDCSFNHNTDYGSAEYDYTYSPTPEVIAELKQIIEEEHGLKDFFFETLQKNHFRISEEFKLENRDTCLREFPIFPRVYPRCADVLKDVFTDLLSAKWLENDINGLKYYLDQNTPIERHLDLGKLLEAKRVWKLVKQAVEAKINHDEKLNKHFYDELKKDIKNLGISSMVSLVPGCGAAFLGGVGRTVINTLGNYVDPEGKQTSVQMMKLLGGSGLGKLMGGDVFELGTSMGIDLVEFYVRDEKTTKNEGSALSIYTSALKGLFTGDKQKLIAQILGTCVAETAERVDDKDAPLDIKIILALLKNPDARGLIVNDIVNEFSKEKPKTESELKPKEQIITEVEPEQIIKSEEGKYPKRDIADGKITLEELKYRAEYAQWEQHNLQLRAAQDEVIQKDAGVRNAEKYLKDKTEAYNKKVGFFHFAAKESSKLDNAHKNLKTAEGELKTAQENLKNIQNVVVPEPIKPTHTIPQQNRSHLLKAPPKALPIYYGLEKDDKNDFRIYIFHEGKTPKAVGRFDSENKAVGAVNELNDYVRQVNTQNAEIYDLQRRYESLGLSPSDLPKTPQFEPIYPAINAPGDSKAKVYLGEQRILKTDSNTDALNTFKGLLSDDLAGKKRVLSDYKAAMDLKAPKHIVPPTGNIKAPINNNDGNYHHLSYVDDSGKTQGLGKYEKAEGAKQVSGGWSHHQVKKADLENRCYEGQKQLFEQGVPIEKIRQIPNFETPILDGKDAEKSCQKIAESNVRNTKMATAYLNELKALAKDPLKIEGLSKSEINHISQDMIPKIKDAKEHGFFFNTYRAPRKGLQWLDDHGVQLTVNVDISKPLYKTNTKERTPSYVGNYGYDAPKQEPISSLGKWENVQATQRDQLFNMNMDYKSPIDNSPQGKLDYQQFWGQGLNPNAQIPPSDWSNLGRNDPEHRITGMKHYPDGDRTQSNIPKWLRYFASGGEPIDPQERININTQSLVATAKVAGQAFGEIADELRSFGCVNAKFDQGKVTLRFDRTISSQIGGLMDQFLPNMDHVPNFRYVEFTARIGNDIMLQAFLGPFFQAQKAKPLLDRVLVRPQGFGQQVRMIEAFQKPALRSGLGFPKLGLMPGQPKFFERTVLKLEGLEIKASRGINRSNNHQFVTWIEGGQTRTASVGEMSYSGTFKDKGKEGISKAGRGLQKHAARENPSMPKPSGNISEVNSQGQKILDEILNHPNKIIIVSNNATKRVGTNVIDVFIPEKYGARFTQDGKTFIGFLEPNRVPK